LVGVEGRAVEFFLGVPVDFLTGRGAVDAQRSGGGCGLGGDVVGFAGDSGGRRRVSKGVAVVFVRTPRQEWGLESK
jgi:hypothetical protein